MQVRALEQDMAMVGSRDIAGAASTSAAALGRLFHRGDHLGVLAHAEIVVGTSDGHVLNTVFSVADRLRELARLAFEIGKDAVATFVMQAIQRIAEKCFEIHGHTRSSRRIRREAARAP